jgi:transcriptional regulator with XRE-family HTH domain
MQNDLRHTPRSLRVRLGLTQIELAARAKVADRTVRNLEDGLDVSLENLRAIAEALEVPAAVVLEALEAERARRRDGMDA